MKNLFLGERCNEILGVAAVIKYWHTNLISFLHPFQDD
jgi:hypothetical protein